MKKDITDLAKEHEEAEASLGNVSANPIKNIIQSLFSNEFKGKSYTKFTIKEAKELVIEKISLAIEKPGPFSLSGNNLIRTLKKCKTVNDMLIELNEYLFN